MASLGHITETSSSSASVISNSSRVMYNPPDDINAFSNLDRFLRATIPKSLADFDIVGIFGARVLLTHESTNV